MKTYSRAAHLALEVTKTVALATVAVLAIEALRRALMAGYPMWKAVRRAVLEIHNTDLQSREAVLLHYACPPAQLSVMHRCATRLLATFTAGAVNPRVAGLRRLGAFPAMRPVCVVARDDEADEVLVMLRGRHFSEEDELIKTWAQADVCVEGRLFKAFEGFVTVFRAIEVDVKRVLLQHEGRVRIVGHSLGAGVAALLAISLHLAFPGRVASVVLLANTRVASPALADHLRTRHPDLWSCIWRVTNECDPICHVPLSYMPGLAGNEESVSYAHFGQCALLFDSMCANIARCHQLQTYCSAIEQALGGGGGGAQGGPASCSITSRASLPKETLRGTP